MSVPMVHMTVLMTNVFALSYCNNKYEFAQVIQNRESMPSLPFHTNYMFLTIWTLVIVTFFHAAALLNHFIGNNENYHLRRDKVPLVRYVKDSVFSVAFPLSVYVTVAYWTLRTIDREYVDPEVLQLPLWLNHILHTFGTLSVLLEFALARRGAQILGHHLVVAVTAAYVWVTLYFYYGRAVCFYPIIAAIPHPFNVVFVLLSAAGIYAFYLKVEEYDRQRSIANASGGKIE